MEFTIEYWFRIHGEKDFEQEKIIADTYEKARKKIRNTKRMKIFKYEDKTKYSEEIKRSGLVNLLKRNKKQ